MKHIIKLFLLAALTLPGWVTTTAQEAQPQRKVALERAQFSDNGRVKKSVTAVQAPVVTPTVIVAQPEECKSVEEAACCETTYELAPDRSSVAPAAAPVFTPSPSRAEIAPITTNEKVTRYHWVDKPLNLTASSTTGNSYVPITCNYLENSTCHGQMIYSSSLLSDMTGKRIKSIKFFVKEGSLTANSGSTSSLVTLSLGETSSSSYSSASFYTGLSKVAKVAKLLKGGTEVVFDFTYPYTYNGGNLVVDVSGDGSGDAYTSSSFKWEGVSLSDYYYYSVYQYGSYSVTGTGFLPIISFDYEEEESYETDAPVSGNKDFFHAIEYTWPINVAEASRPEENKARLDTIATDPDQMIALLYEVYTNKAIPGNWKRGYDQNGHAEPYDDVSYTGVGAVSHTGSDYTTGYSYVNDYGWGIPGNIVTKVGPATTSSNYTVYYAHMDSTQYKPNQDGLTLLLIEMRDDFTTSGLNTAVNAAKQQSGYTSYDVLKARIGYAFKSVRVITESMRSGSGNDAGTLFKIDCDKMNKFYMVAKGQVRYPFNSNSMFNEEGYFNSSRTFCRMPVYAFCENLNFHGDESEGHGGWEDDGCCSFLAHMFEQFSPYDLDTQEEIKNVYQHFVNMESYDVPHDCVSIPVAYAEGSSYKGHYFRMYKDQDDAYDCQDVRDLMFFVPDYRMKYFANQTITNEYSVNVAEGTVENKYIPIYGYYYGYYGSYANYSQMIYPASMLTNLAGKKIKSITFYPSSTISISGGSIQVDMGVTSSSNFNSATGYLTPNDGYVSTTITPSYGATELTVTFDSPFTYTSGTNLLVDFTVKTRGSSSQMTWIGMETDDNQSIDSSPDGNYSIYKNKFLPTMKVTWEETTTEGGNRDSNNGYTAQGVKYLNYNPVYRPSMALYVIRQDTVSCPMDQRKEKYYKLTLTWDSNMDDFLPGKKQEYNLMQLVTDEYGMNKYIPVYKTNELGQYWNGTTWQADTTRAEKVVLILNPNDAKTYTDVYVQRTPGSQQVTYAIQGRDENHFLSLQMSNQQSYFIPGTDPAEMALLGDVTYYSRYNPQTQRNCYSNKLVLRCNPNSIKESYLKVKTETAPGTEIKLKRYTSAEDTNPVTVATAEVVRWPGYEGETFKNGKLLVTMTEQEAKTAFPTGKSDIDKKYAGYHANKGDETLTMNGEGNCQWEKSFYIRDGYVSWGELEFYDNFTVEVKQKDHPLQYLYKVEFETAVNFGDEEHPAYQAYSNTYRIPVYQTDSKISARTLDEVLGDTKFNTDYSPSNVTFQEEVQYSSKTEIYRYDAYRWTGTNANDFYTINKVGNNDNEDLIGADGIASNQGEGYTVSMNHQGTDDYQTTSVEVSQSDPWSWAQFIDCVPAKSEAATVYTYAPVVELFTKGVDAAGTAHRSDINTYGGPMQTTAVGKLAVKVDNPDNDHPLMSDYRWYMYDDNGNGDWYSYYNIYLKFDALNLPAGYELYKVRAWRRMASEDEEGNVVVDNSILGEEIETRRDVRIGQIDDDGWYMYEDINYGDPLDLATREQQSVETMSCTNLADRLLGDRSTQIEKPVNPDGTGGGTVFEPDSTANNNGNEEHEIVEDNVRNEVRATFGALRLKNVAINPGTLEELNAEFRVRAYFTKNDNPLITDPVQATTTTPRRDGETQSVPGSDFKYYVAEGTAMFKSSDYGTIVTGIDAVKQEANREVVGVTYVNTVGQISSTPWQGVNIVVTRYSDGSTTTKKVIK